jgi:hypothetical protein
MMNYMSLDDISVLEITLTTYWNVGNDYLIFSYDSLFYFFTLFRIVNIDEFFYL